MPNHALDRRLARIRRQLAPTTPAEHQVTFDLISDIEHDRLTDTQRTDPWIQQLVAIVQTTPAYLAQWERDRGFPADDLRAS